MLEVATNTVLKSSLFTAIIYSTQNTIEKYLFTNLNVNINNYLLIRNVLMALLFIVIYFNFKKYLLDSNFSNINIITNNKLVLGLIFISTILSLLFSHLSNFSVKKYNISLFTIIFTVLYLIFNTVSGIIFFKESIHAKQLLGITLGICSVILLNY